MEAYLQGPFGQIVLGPDVVTIGRSLDNRLVVNNPIASSHHANIRPQGYGYCISDLGSTNGTFVNEQLLTPNFPFVLQKGDRIRISDMTFLFETGRSDYQVPFAQSNGLMNTPTAKVPAIGYNAFNQSEQFGEKPPAPYPTSTLVQPVSRGFEQPHFAPLPANNAYSMNAAVQPRPFQASFTPPITTNNAYGMNALIQPQPFQPASMPPPPTQLKKSNTGLKVLLISLSIILILGAVGGGITAYMLTRPKPVMAVTSNYHVGSMPAGSTSTTLHITASNFSGSSAITFLLDNQPVASNQHVTSDANGNVKTDLAIASDWAVGNHTLTARDASGYTTKVGSHVAVVAQGQANTPGPNGSPTDSASFSIDITVRLQDAGTGKQSQPFTETLVITGKPDLSGGTVCQSYDDGKPNSLSQTDNGVQVQITAVFSCSGTYKGGKLSYTETATSLKITAANGGYCVAHTPFIYQKLDGSFANHSVISGTASGDSITFNCNLSINTQSNARTGSWTGQLTN